MSRDPSLNALDTPVTSVLLVSSLTIFMAPAEWNVPLRDMNA